MSRVEEGLRLHPSRLRSISVRGLALRFAFGATISVIAGLVGNHWGPVAGGVFLAFPALLAATLTLIDKKDQRSRPAAHDAKSVALGAAGMIGIAGCVWGLAVTLPAWLVLLIAIAAWAVLADVLYLIFGRLTPSTT
ncbi:DUF3147 family protein [Herbidospora mongoliensis]|uniref:DUF3147 family protein n=1 Tax=Herbidospora mongoliensis TaxID=688067 RepID=UPI000ABFD4A4|nr:DUF3147 family protein [Herbidospora mongoliensis]